MYSLTGDGMSQKLIELSEISSSASEIDAVASLAHPSLTRFLNKLKAESSHITIFVNGDSTGDSTTEWVYFFSQWLADEYPNYSVVYYDWNNTLDSYETVTTIHTGTNGFNIKVFNASTGSQPVYYLMNESKKQNAIVNIIDRTIFPESSSTVDLTIINHSHNHIGEVVENNLLYWNALFTEEYLNIHKESGFIFIKQNPWQSNYNNKLRVDKAVAWANIKNMPIADVWNEFVLLNKNASLYADNIHPSVGIGTEEAPTGTRLFLNAVTKLLDNKVSSNNFYFPKSNLLNYSKSFNYNPNLEHKDGDSVPPTGYTVSGGTATKDTSIFYSNKKPYSTKVTATGGVPCFLRLKMTDSEISKLKGKNILVAILINFPYTEVVGKNKMQTSTTSQDFKVEKNLYHLTGGWNWRFVPVYISPTDTFLNLYINLDSSSTVVDGAYCNVDRIIVSNNLEPFGETI